MARPHHGGMRRAELLDTLPAFDERNVPASPLSDEQLHALDRFLEPLSPDQLLWIGGYLAGLAAAHRNGTPRLVPADDQDEAPLTIAYGSQSGNGAGIATEIKAQAEARGFKVRLRSMDAYRPSELRS